MKREIKFRAWDGNRNRMLCEDYFYVRYGKVYGFREFDDPCVRDWQLMQYTGINDKNGVEIYEGDIIQWHHNTDDIRHAAVTFSEGCFYTIYGASKYRLGGWKTNVIEVIGNIYENPELLEEH